MPKRILQGVVVSDKQEKTLVVKVERRFTHPLLKKTVRGVRPIERALEARSDPQAEAVRGYCLAVRSALTDDGRPPLDASGLQLHERLTTIHDSLSRVVEKGGPRPS